MTPPCPPPGHFTPARAFPSAPKDHSVEREDDAGTQGIWALGRLLEEVLAAYSSQSSGRSGSTRGRSLSPVCLHNNWGVQLCTGGYCPDLLSRPSFLECAGLLQSRSRSLGLLALWLCIPGTRREPRRHPHHQGSPIEAWDTPGAEKARLPNSEKASNLSGTLSWGVSFGADDA